MPPTRATINADSAWSNLTKTLAHTVPKHLHNAQTNWRKLAHMRSRS